MNQGCRNQGGGGTGVPEPGGHKQHVPPTIWQIHYTEEQVPTHFLKQVPLHYLRRSGTPVNHMILIFKV